MTITVINADGNPIPLDATSKRIYKDVTIYGYEVSKRYWNQRKMRWDYKSCRYFTAISSDGGQLIGISLKDCKAKVDRYWA